MLVRGNERGRGRGLCVGGRGGARAGRAARHYLARTGDLLASRGSEMRAALFRALAKAVVPAAFAWGLALGLNTLVLVDRLAGWRATGLELMGILVVGYVLYVLVDVEDAWLKGWARQSQSKLNDMLVPMVSKSLRVTLVVLVLVQVAQALSDQPVSSILAGLGIGSLAVALAAKDTIANFFGSLVILADKPFEMGERIKVRGADGVVEELGFRSTRIRTLEGHLVSVPNGELANQTIENVSKRPRFRRIANLTITYDTPPVKVAEAVEIVKEVLKDHEGMHPDFPPRVFFSEFNEASLNLFVIYWYHPADYWKYMEFSERVNMELLRRFNAAGIEFAFPTQTLYLAGDPARPLKLGAGGAEGGRGPWAL